MIFKYELRLAAFTFHMAESLLVGRNFVFGICKLIFLRIGDTNKLSASVPL